MAQQVATRQPSPTKALQIVVADRAEEIKKALPGHISVDRFVRTAQTAIAMTRNIEKAKPQSLLIACTKAAADGLILDGREAALVVDYQGDVQYRPMMRGLLKLAYQSGAVSSISVQLVCEADEFEYLVGDDERITHRIDFREDRGTWFAVYGIAKLATGEVIREVMTRRQVLAIRDRSDAWKAFKAGKIKSTPWGTDEEEMARKTLFRRLSKYIPSSADRNAFHSAVERIDEDYTFDPPVYDNDPGEDQDTPRATAKKRGAAAAALKDVTPAKPARQTKPKPQEPAQPEDESQSEYDPETGEFPPDDEGYGDMIHDDGQGASDDI